MTEITDIQSQTAGTATDTPAEALPSNSLRRYLLIQNKDSANTIFVGIVQSITLTTTNGYEILPKGSLVFENVGLVDPITVVCDTGLTANYVISEGEGS